MGEGVWGMGFFVCPITGKSLKNALLDISSIRLKVDNFIINLNFTSNKKDALVFL